MSAVAAEKFTDTALQHFPPYRWTPEQERNWAEAVMRKIAHFSDEIIDRASDDMLEKRRRTGEKGGIPAVSECIEYCVGAKRFLDLQKHKGQLPINERPWEEIKPENTKERWKIANDIARNPADPMCVQAAKEGWNETLYTFVINHGRMPDQRQRIEYRKSRRDAPEMVSEIEWCRREAKDCVHAVVRAEKLLADATAKSDPMEIKKARILVEMGKDVLAKRRKHADQILGGAR